MTDVIDFFINYKKTVMGLIVSVQGHARILGIVSRYILTKLLCNSAIININIHTGISF